MSKRKSRFVVDKEGCAKDRRLEIEIENEMENRFEREAKAKQAMQEMEKRRYELSREYEQKFLKQEEYKQSKNGVKLGSLICALGVISLSEAFKSGAGFASFWGLVGIFAVLIGAILLVTQFLVRSGGPPA